MPSVGFAKTGEQIVLLADAVKAAQRSLEIADRPVQRRA